MTSRRQARSRAVERRFSSVLNRRHQLTLPKHVREHLGLSPGDRVEFVIKAKGCALLNRAGRSRLAELSGMLHDPTRRPATVEEMNEGIEREHGKRP